MESGGCPPVGRDLCGVEGFFVGSRYQYPVHQMFPLQFITAELRLGISSEITGWLGLPHEELC